MMQKSILTFILLLSFVVFTPTAEAACLTLTRDLSMGSKGSDVAALQDFLYPVYMRYYAPSGRGTFGNFTKGAVMKFQMTFGITQTGGVGPITREKIRQISCGLSSSTTNTTSNTTGTSNTSTIYCSKPPKLCPDGKTLVIGRGATCIYDACPTNTLSTNTTGVCANERLACDDGSTVGRTGPNCAFAACPTTTNTTNTNSSKRCSDGTTVGAYELCYKTCSNGVRILDTQSCSIFGSTATTPSGTTGTMVCAQDVYMCSNGSYVTRSGPNCTFASCPTSAVTNTTPVSTTPTNTGTVCTYAQAPITMKTCSDGAVIRETQNCGAPTMPTCSPAIYPSPLPPNYNPYTIANAPCQCTDGSILTSNGGVCPILPTPPVVATCTTNTTTGTTNTAVSGFRPTDIALSGQPIQFENQRGTGNTFLNGEYGLPVSTTGVITTSPLTKLYETAFDFVYAAGYFMRARLPLKPHEAFSIRVDIPLTSDGVLGTIEVNENTVGPLAANFISISETRGDFDLSKAIVQTGTVLTGNPCYRGGMYPVITFYTSSTGEYISRYENGAATSMSKQTADTTRKTQCRLIPGKTYYFNFRFQALSKPNEDSCAITTQGWPRPDHPYEPLCGALIRIGYGPPVPLNPIGTWNNLLGTTVTTPTSGPDIAIDGSIIPTISYLPGQIVPQRNNGDPNYNGMSSIINAYSVKDISPCNTSKRSTTAPITRLWQHNIDLKDFTQRGNTQSYGIEPNEALTYKFVANFIGVVTIKTEDGSEGSSVPSFMSVSSSPCDFDVTKLNTANRNYCYSTEGMPANGVIFRVVPKNTTPTPSSVCTLIEGNTYYMNIRSLDARILDGREKLDACQARKDYMGFSTLRCGGIFNLRPS